MSQPTNLGEVLGSKEEKDLALPDGTKGTYKPLRAPPHPDGKKYPLTGVMEAVVDPTPQELRKIRDLNGMVIRIPGSLSAAGQTVLYNLLCCFEKQGFVAEGLIGDLIWGFLQAVPPVPTDVSISGVDELRRLGYLKLQAKDNTYVDFYSDKVESAWIRYQPKLLEMVYEGG